LFVHLRSAVCLLRPLDGWRFLHKMNEWHDYVTVPFPLVIFGLLLVLNSVRRVLSEPNGGQWQVEVVPPWDSNGSPKEVFAMKKCWLEEIGASNDVVLL
jgi:hypothetical protein